MHRYLAFIWDPDVSETSQQAQRLLATILATRTWESAYQDSGVQVVHQPPRQRSPSLHLLSNQSGIVLGTLFYQPQPGIAPRASADLNDRETQRITESGARYLTQRYWGSYFALVREPAGSSYSVLRDPTANLACYHAKWGAMHVFFSDMEDFVRYVRMPLSINWRHLACRLLAGFTLSRECGYNEIEDIPGGEKLTVTRGRTHRTPLWRPAEICGERPLEDAATAAQELRATVLSTIYALAHEHDSILVRLSGGLDSSIVASSLAQCGAETSVTCLNFYVLGDSSGDRRSDISIPGLSPENLAKARSVIGNADEREFARKVANRCGFKLVERERPVGDIDFSRLYAPPLAPRPIGYGFVLDIDDAECEFVDSSQATACFSGQGGDTVLYASQRPVGAIDYAILHPFGPGLFREIASATTLSRESLFRVFHKVVKHGYLRLPLPPIIDPKTRSHLLPDDLAATLLRRSASHHPWLDSAQELCPGKQSHVAGLLNSVPAYHHSYRRERIAPSIHPLASQPVVETCLRIPSYALLTDGTSRGLARRAFRDMLPSEISRRLVKGTGLALYQNLLKRNMRRIAKDLLDSPLVTQHVIDRQKLEASLTTDQPYLAVRAPQILDCLTCHAWLTQVPST